MKRQTLKHLGEKIGQWYWTMLHFDLIDKKQKDIINSVKTKEFATHTANKGLTPRMSMS